MPRTSRWDAAAVSSCLVEAVMSHGGGTSAQARTAWPQRAEGRPRATRRRNRPWEGHAGPHRRSVTPPSSPSGWLCVPVVFFTSLSTESSFSVSSASDWCAQRPTSVRETTRQRNEVLAGSRHGVTVPVVSISGRVVRLGSVADRSGTA